MHTLSQSFRLFVCWICYEFGWVSNHFAIFISHSVSRRMPGPTAQSIKLYYTSITLLNDSIASFSCFLLIFYVTFSCTDRQKWMSVMKIFKQHFHVAFFSLIHLKEKNKREKYTSAARRRSDMCIPTEMKEWRKESTKDTSIQFHLMDNFFFHFVCTFFCEFYFQAWMRVRYALCSQQFISTDIFICSKCLLLKCFIVSLFHCFIDLPACVFSQFSLLRLPFFKASEMKWNKNVQHFPLSRK